MNMRLSEGSLYVMASSRQYIDENDEIQEHPIPSPITIDFATTAYGKELWITATSCSLTKGGEPITHTPPTTTIIIDGEVVEITTPSEDLVIEVEG